MKMISIAARAYELAMQRKRGMICTYDALVKIATEQDRISRAEERERCIRSAQDWYCDRCTSYMSLDGKCKEIEEIRKAIEEGGNNEN